MSVYSCVAWSILLCKLKSLDWQDACTRGRREHSEHFEYDELEFDLINFGWKIIEHLAPRLVISSE